MENVVHVEMVQRWKSLSDYLTYIEKKYGPSYLTQIKQIAEKVDFASTSEKNFVCRIVDGSVIGNSGSASMFNIIDVAYKYSLKVADPVVACLMYIELLDKPYLKAQFSSLYFIASSLVTKFKGYIGVSCYTGTPKPHVEMFNYANVNYTSFRQGTGFVFEVKEPEVIPAGLDRV